MSTHNNETDQPARTPWLQWLGVAVGGVAIVVLLYAMLTTAEEHVVRAKEVSRDTQWQVHAPVKGAQAAALLQGEQP